MGSVFRSWPLTGRAEELQLIAECCSAPSVYAGVVIVGPAGTGKSRLAREAMELAAQTGATVRFASGTSSGRSIPLGAFAEWADPHQGSVLQAVSAAVDSLTSTTRRKRVIVVVDDAHLLDELSAFLLHQLVIRRLATVVATIRSGEQAPDPVTTVWKDGHLRLLQLQPLSRGESDLLLAGALGGELDPDCARRLWEVTRGNVLQLRHLVDQEVATRRLAAHAGVWTWTDAFEVSSSLTDLIEAQVGVVPQDVLDVIDMVAVAEPVDLGLLSALADNKAIETAERRGLIGITPDRHRAVVHIGHPLYGEVRRDRAGPVRLRRLRGRIVTAMVAIPDLDDTSVLRAATMSLDADLSPLPQLLARAAQIAFSRLDLGLSERLAGACADAGGPTAAALLRAQSLGLLNRAAESQLVLDALEPRLLSDHELAHATALRISNLWSPLERPEEAAAIVDEAMSRPNPVLANAGRAMRVLHLAAQARPAEALALAVQVDETDLGDFVAAELAWGKTIAAGDLGRIADIRSAARTGYDIAAASIEAAYLGVGLAEFHVKALLLAGLTSEALAVAREVAEQCADAPGAIGAIGAGIAAIAWLGSGRLDLAREQLNAAARVLSLGVTSASLRGRFAVHQAETLAKLGETDAATEHTHGPYGARHSTHLALEPDRMLAQAWVSANRGARSEAVRIAHRAADYARAQGQLTREVFSLQTATHFGDATTAARLEDLSRLVDAPRVSVAVAFADALAAADGDRLRSASERFEAMGDLFAAADVAAHAAVAYRRRDLRGSALTAAGRAQRLATVCGSAVSPAIREARQPLPLTAREREIVALVAQGWSNRRIAEELGMSIRTIEGHLYRASQRSGAAGRDQLAALLGEFDGDR
ncbi:LuxR C-terminal-related transcriptional regulator [Mycobacterium sp.]|uniref:LuxR C-terminal-related transcriptional regulator n=1 Tax=Mycobacterium sp. TaxID=1785 RepID=UPI002D1DB529|nr:LuxR C-terminal-related transcriptional regulator [Mycobacterium sp.]HTQ19487.1 LuxR C-terminal-related transcriptional regulator [Mycobacterium sp.]